MALRMSAFTKSMRWSIVFDWVASDWAEVTCDEDGHRPHHAVFEHVRRRLYLVGETVVEEGCGVTTAWAFDTDSMDGVCDTLEGRVRRIVPSVPSDE